MTSKELLYVKTIAEIGNMSKAAKKLFIAQPSLSQSLQRLEDSLGAPLFNRTPGGLTLTYTKEVGGERRYHLRIHNQRFDRLNDIEKKAILNRVGKVDFGVEGCSLYQEYN